MNARFFYPAVLAIFVVIDAWLLAHPNVIGKMGVLMYKYDMIRTFPLALATVGLTVLVAAVLAEVLLGKLSPKNGRLTLGILLLVSAGLFVQTWFKFSVGSYALTGAGFKVGARLLPFLLVIIFGKTFIQSLQNKP